MKLSTTAGEIHFVARAGICREPLRRRWLVTSVDIHLAPDIISTCTQRVTVPFRTKLQQEEEEWMEESWFTAEKELATCCKLLSGRSVARRRAGCSSSPGEITFLQLFHLLLRLPVCSRMAAWHTPSSLRLSLPLRGLRFQS